MKPQPYTSIFIILASIGFTLLIATAIDPYSGSRTNLADRTIFDEVLDEDASRSIYANNMRRMNAAAPVFYRNGEVVEVAPKKRQVDDNSSTEADLNNEVDEIGNALTDGDSDIGIDPDANTDSVSDDKDGEIDEAAVVKDDDGKDVEKKKDKNNKKKKKKKNNVKNRNGIPMGFVVTAGGVIVVLFVLIFLFVFKRGKKNKATKPSEETIIENQPTKDVQKGSSRLEQALTSMEKDKSKER